MKTLPSFPILWAAFVLSATRLPAAELCLILDMSGSMEVEHRADHVKAAAGLVVGMAERGDQLVVVGFGQEIQVSPQFVLDRAAARTEARQWIQNLRVDGKTDYIAALKAHPLTAQTEVIFLSDGAHNGPPEEVLDYVRSNLGGKVQLHTVSVGCEPQSDTEQLLRDMAVATQGTYSRVEASEQLVQSLCRIVVRLGTYRSHAPQEEILQLSNVQGRVLAFTFDALPTVSTVERRLAGKEYTAELPDETVRLWVGQLNQPHDLVLRYTAPESSRSRWGDLFRTDLPSSHLTVPNYNGSLAAGDPLEPELAFTAPDGTVIDPRRQPNLTGELELIDGNGNILDRTTATPAVDRPVLKGSLKTPNSTQPVTVRSRTSVTDRGVPWTDERQLELQVVAPSSLTVTPAKLVGTSTVGPFETRLQITVPDGIDVRQFTARLNQPVAGLTFLKAESLPDGLAVHFDGESPGTKNGTLVVTAQADVPMRKAMVPFTFEIKPRPKGLSVPVSRETEFGAHLAGSGRQSVQLPFPSRDESPTTYRVEVHDLASGDRAIPLQLAAREFTASRDQPGVLVATVDVGNIPEGEYRGRIVVDNPDLPGTRWTTQLVLQVVEPLKMAPVNVGHVAAGTIHSGTLVLENRGVQEIAEVSLRMDSFHDSANEPTKQLIGELPTPPKVLKPRERRSVPFQIAVSPLMDERGEFSADVVVQRGGVESFRVPIRLTVDEPGSGPSSFTVAPERLQLTGSRSSVVRFTVRIQPTLRLMSAAKLAAVVGAYHGMNDRLLQITTALKWPRGETLRPGQAIELQGFLVAPRTVGTYETEITLSSNTTPDVILPLQLTVR